MRCSFDIEDILPSKEETFGFENELRIIREKYAQHPYQKKTFPKPYWMEGDDLSILYEEQSNLFQMGRIYYGYIVQANNYLFQKDPYINCPAAILYSTDDRLNRNPAILKKVGKWLFSYKNTDEAPEHVKRVVDAITDEKERLFNVKIEINMNDGSQAVLYYTTVMIFRKHLPEGMIKGSFLPIIASPNMFKTVMVLPKKYWTKRFIKNWWC